MVNNFSLNYKLEVPANSSRFFQTSVEASSQPRGFLDFEYHQRDLFIVNHGYNSKLISYDNNYMTCVFDDQRRSRIPTTHYFFNLISQSPPPRGWKIVDIGCGQGEFVDYLRDAGFDAFGWDPSLRRENRFLKKGFWAPGLTSKVWLFTMRCVLPHIENPFHFLDSMAQEHPNAMVLIEFQSLDWLLRNGVWYQLCHDHVNQFRIIDFARRFSLISSGSFANGEWEWVLIRLAKSTSKLNQESQDDSLELKSRFKSLKEKRQEFLDAVTDWQKPILIWGAAGKGINLADFLARYTSTQINITDMDFHRWQLYLEGSGYLVLNPEIALLSLPSDGVIFVSNPNHLEVVRNFAKEHKLVFPACEVSFVF